MVVDLSVFLLVVATGLVLLPVWLGANVAILHAVSKRVAVSVVGALLLMAGSVLAPCIVNVGLRPMDLWRKSLVAAPIELGVVGIVALAVFAVRSRRRAVTARGRCAACGYDLTGHESGVCSECGAEINGNCKMENGKLKSDMGRAAAV